MIYLSLHILLLLAVLFLFLGRISSGSDKIIFLAFVSLKVTCGVLVGVLYFSFYGGIGDTVYFYEQAQALHQFFLSDRISFSEWVGLSPLSLTQESFPLQADGRNFFFVRIISFLYAFTQGSYYFISIYLSFFGSLATWAFASQLIKVSTLNRHIVYMALLFIPSIAFWSSGLLKESVMSIALYSLGLSVLVLRSKWNHWIYFVLCVLSVYLLWRIKYYVPIALTPIVFLTLLFDRKSFLKRFTFSKKIAVYYFFLMIGGAFIAFSHPVFNSGQFFELVRISHNIIASNSAEAIINFKTVDSDSLFFFINLPFAWFTGIFRPLIWEAFSPLSIIWALEKTVFTLMALSSIVVSFKLTYSRQEVWWGMAIILYASVLAGVITIATPNFGSLIRYEIAYMPFLWLLVFMILYKYNKKHTPFKEWFNKA